MRIFVRAICWKYFEWYSDFIHTSWLGYLDLIFRHQTSTTHTPPATVPSTTPSAPVSGPSPAEPPSAGSGAWTSPGDIVSLLSPGVSNPRIAAPEDHLAESPAPNVFQPSQVGDTFRSFPERPGAIVYVSAPEVKTDTNSAIPGWVTAVCIILALVIVISFMCCCLLCRWLHTLRIVLISCLSSSLI